MIRLWQVPLTPTLSRRERGEAENPVSRRGRGRYQLDLTGGMARVRGNFQRWGDGPNVDFVYVAVTVAFFTVAWGYVWACERF